MSAEVSAATIVPFFGFGRDFSSTAVHAFGTWSEKPFPSNFVRFTLSDDPLQEVRKAKRKREERSFFILMEERGTRDDRKYK